MPGLFARWSELRAKKEGWKERESGERERGREGERERGREVGTRLSTTKDLEQV